MASTFAFSEERIRKLKPPADKDREYYKDRGFPGLQICCTAAGSRTYYLVKRTDGRPTRHKLGTFEELSVKQAREAAAAIAGKIAMGQNPQAERRTMRQEPTIKDLWDHWLLYANAHKKPRSRAEDERNYRLHLSPLANRRLSTITKSELQSLNSKLGTEKGICAANRSLSLLRAMYNRADDIGYTGRNPAKGVKAFREQSRDRYLQPGELESFFAALQAETPLFRDFFEILLFTGARKGNVLSMAWPDVSLDDAGGFWRIPETKNGRPVIVPLVGPALAILRARKETANGSPWVFPGKRRGTHLLSEQHAWGRILKRAKLHDLHPHDLRRSLGSWMASQKCRSQSWGRSWVTERPRRRRSMPGWQWIRSGRLWKTPRLPCCSPASRPSCPASTWSARRLATMARKLNEPTVTPPVDTGIYHTPGDRWAGVETHTPEALAAVAESIMRSWHCPTLDEELRRIIGNARVGKADPREYVQKAAGDVLTAIYHMNMVLATGNVKAAACAESKSARSMSSCISNWRTKRTPCAERKTLRRLRVPTTPKRPRLPNRTRKSGQRLDDASRISLTILSTTLQSGFRSSTSTNTEKQNAAGVGVASAAQSTEWKNKKLVGANRRFEL